MVALAFSGRQEGRVSQSRPGDMESLIQTVTNDIASGYPSGLSASVPPWSSFSQSTQSTSQPVVAKMSAVSLYRQGNVFENTRHEDIYSVL